MELVFLGTGTSQGVPMIAHDPPGLDLSDPRNWRTRTSAHVVLGEHRLQIDAAPELRLQCLQNDIRDVDALLVTHAHADHLMGMDDLRRFVDLHGGRALPVYGNTLALTRIAQIFPYAIRPEPEFKGYPAFDLQPMPECLELPGGTVAATPLPHGRMETLGLVFTEAVSGKRLAYYTDCHDVPEAAIELARGAEVCVLDALRPTQHSTHMSVEEATAVASRIGAAQTFFTHMTFMIDHARAEAALPPGIRFAYDGLRVSL